MKKLLPKHYECMMMILNGCKYREICDKLSITPQTLWIWKRDILFSTELHRLQDDIHSSILKRITAFSDILFDETMKILQSDDSSLKSRLIPHIYKVLLQSMNQDFCSRISTQIEQLENDFYEDTESEK